MHKGKDATRKHRLAGRPTLSGAAEERSGDLQDLESRVFTT